MIKTETLSDSGVVVHRLEGPLDPKEVEATVSELLSQVGDTTVIWDVRNGEFSHYTYADAKVIDESIEAQYSQMADHRRAFLVRDELQRQLIVMIVGRTRAPFSWQVFEDWDEALAWVQAGS